jgi:cobalt-zinc-cadmium efflux system outer membrane protein
MAQADLVQAGLLRNPVFGITRSRPRSESITNFELEIAWDFLGALTIPLRKKAAEDAFEAAKLRVTSEVMSLASDVSKAFYEAQANQQMVEMMKRVVEGTGAALFAAKRLRAAGNITELDLDKRSTLHYESRLMLNSAESALVASHEHLNVLMGLWGTATRWNMQPRLPDVPEQALDLSNIESNAVKNSLQLAIIKHEIRRAAQRAGLADATAFINDLEIGFSTERDDGKYQDSILLEFNLPIFDLGQARKARAQAEFQQLRARYVEQAIMVRSSARNAANQIRIARERERFLRNVLMPLRERITNATQLEYNGMQVGVFGLLLTHQQQIVTAQRYIEALRDYWLARANAGQVQNGGMADGSMMMSSGAMSMSGGSEGGH